ncbi:MAG: hypothetical protein HY887_09585 [Deltaproteobacteria bacterium]|nr:hypothetical protein [Deltaproteobacteria bacterium]
MTDRAGSAIMPGSEMLGKATSGKEMPEKPTVEKPASPALYSHAFLSEYGRIESRRARFFDSHFSVLFIHIRALEGSRERGGSASALANAVRASLRPCDVAGLAGEGQIAVIMPETDFFGAFSASKKLSRTFESFKDIGAANISITQAAFPADGADFDAVLSSAVRRDEERRNSLWERLGLKDKLFWEITDELFSSVYDGAIDASMDTGPGNDLSEFFIDQVNDCILREIKRTPRKNAVLYMTLKKVHGDHPVVRALNSSAPLAARIVLAGERDPDVGYIKNAASVYIDDERLMDTVFTFFLSEDSAYALICKENWGGAFSCFHTSDACLVDGLISKFQREYALQELF